MSQWRIQDFPAKKMDKEEAANAWNIMSTMAPFCLLYVVNFSKHEIIVPPENFRSSDFWHRPVNNQGKPMNRINNFI